MWRCKKKFDFSFTPGFSRVIDSFSKEGKPGKRFPNFGLA